ncbi:MAG: sugar ABC transporter permease [Firmicutes bacterium]|nr:sugar ABC transporter permease [Bacillota bacterium]
MDQEVIAKTMASVWARIKKDRWAYIFLLPSFAFFATFFLFPVIWSIVLSFLDYQVWGASFAGLDNYREIMTDRIFWISLRNNFLYALGVVPLWLGKALLISALIFPFRKSIQTFFKAAFYLPHVTSSVIISMIWLWIYNPPFGLLNYIVSLFGREGIAWLGNTKTALPALVAQTVIMGGGSSIVLISAAMNGIPTHLYEAAELDGASKLVTYLWITLPLLKPTILYLMVMGTISSFQVFTQVYMMTKGGPQFATTTIVYLIFEKAFLNFQFGPASAMAVVLFGIIFCFALIQFKWLGEEIEY